MTVIIKLNDDVDQDWQKANWVFRELREHVARLFPERTDVLHELEVAQAFGMLDLSSMLQSTAAAVLESICSAASKTVNGDNDGWRDPNPSDARGHAGYLRSMQELLEKLKK